MRFVPRLLPLLLGLSPLVAATPSPQEEDLRLREIVAGPNGDFLVELKNADMAAVAKIWKGVFGFEAAVGERLKDKQVTLLVRDTSLEQFRKQFTAELERNGVYLVFGQSLAATLDATPDKAARR